MTTAKLVEVGKKMKCGIKGWLYINFLLQNLRETMAERMTRILNPDRDVDELFVKNLEELK